MSEVCCPSACKINVSRCPSSPQCLLQLGGPCSHFVFPCLSLGPRRRLTIAAFPLALLALINDPLLPLLSASVTMRMAPGSCSPAIRTTTPHPLSPEYRVCMLGGEEEAPLGSFQHPLSYFPDAHSAVLSPEHAPPFLLLSDTQAQSTSGFSPQLWPVLSGRNRGP